MIYPMKLLIQRVKNAEVSVEHKCIGKISNGMLIFLGIAGDDTKEIVEKMIQKTFRLRIFEDDQQKTNLSLSDINGSCMIISQFTLYSNCKKGNRPSFIDAAKADFANELYEYFITYSKTFCDKIEHGIFGAEMKVSLLNDGPFTIMLDSKEIL